MDYILGNPHNFHSGACLSPLLVLSPISCSQCSVRASQIPMAQVCSSYKMQIRDIGDKVVRVNVRRLAHHQLNLNMGFLDNLFGQKIILTAEMKIMAEKMIGNNWFENCGVSSAFDTQYRIELVHTIDEAEKKLAYKRDVSGFVTLDNLLIEASRRKQLFLSLNHKNEIENTWNKLTDTIVKAYISNNKLDIDKIQQNFNSKFGVQVDLYLRRIFVETLNELYFKSRIENFPTFFSDIINIYLKGNVVVGWLGKFGSHENQVKEIFPISPNDGILNVW